MFGYKKWGSWGGKFSFNNTRLKYCDKTENEHLGFQWSGDGDPACQPRSTWECVQYKEEDCQVL